MTRSTIPAIQGKQKVATRPSLPRKCRRSSVPPRKINQKKGSASVVIDQAQKSSAQKKKLMPVDVKPEKKKKKMQQQQQKDPLEDVVNVSVAPVNRSTLPANQGKQKVATRPSLPRKCRRSSLPPCESNQERGSASVEIDQAQESRCQMAKLMPVDVEPEMMEKKKVEQQQRETVENVVDVSVSPVAPQPQFLIRGEGQYFRRPTPTPVCHYSLPPLRERSREWRNSRDVIDQVQRSRGKKRGGMFGSSRPSKTLHGASTQERRVPTSPSPGAGMQERRVPTSPSFGLALKAFKMKSILSHDEIKRLLERARKIAETTLHAQMARTQVALSNGLERPVTRDSFFSGVVSSCPGYVPGSIAAQNRGGLAAQSERKRGVEDAVKSDMPFGKRRKTNEPEPLRCSGTTLRGPLTREERRLREPRSSSLLPTRDAATSKMCSDALVKNNLSVLDTVQSPPAQEANKPTPSTTMSGTKNHPSRTNVPVTVLDKGLTTGCDDVPPPTATTTRATFPRSCKEPSTSLYSGAPKSQRDAFSRSATVASADAPALSSPQVTSMISASTSTGTVPEQQQTIGGFKFTLPVGGEGVKHAGVDDKDAHVRFVLSPSPSMREPSVKVLSQKNTKDNGEQSVAAEKATKLSADMPAVPPAASLSGAANPLARFMQLKPGQWKCTGCRVLNEATSGNCPCCGTARPDGGAAAKACTALFETTEKCPLIGLSFGTTTEATAAVDKGTASPAAGSITPRRFCFGFQGVGFIAGTAGLAGSITSNGLSFGAPAADVVQDADTSAFEAAPVECKFTMPAVASDKRNAGDVRFGTSPVSSEKVEASRSTAASNIGISSLLEKTDDTMSRSFVETGKAAYVLPYSLGVPMAFPSGLNTTSCETSRSGGFPFGTTTASTVEVSTKGICNAPEVELLPGKSASTFDFGMATTEATFSVTLGQKPTIQVASSTIPASRASSSPAFDFESFTPAPARAGVSTSPTTSAPAFMSGLSSPQPMESTAFGWEPATTSFGTASSAFGSSSSGGAGSSSTAG